MLPSMMIVQVKKERKTQKKETKNTSYINLSKACKNQTQQNL